MNQRFLELTNKQNQIKVLDLLNVFAINYDSDTKKIVYFITGSQYNVIDDASYSDAMNAIENWKAVKELQTYQD